ncbi:Oligoribonuclease, mitochondrial [Candida viswanathii]|uniref:Oligoribonuclease, mitochondrial n=1 Tax=Candida viswanathii TaxID=5486 RepID=A0A367YNH5_9ASCO|nr:Oligoribonuclease, mitochondrial [Candida viswanathii]
MIKHLVRVTARTSHIRTYSSFAPRIPETAVSHVVKFMADKNRMQPDRPIVWVDCEMTGLDVLGKDHIIEICCLITDKNLELVDETGFESTIYYPKSRLDEMDEWCTETHGRSGLTAKVLAHPERTLQVVETELLEYIKKYVPKERVALLGGNSVHMDRFFMMKEFPRVTDHLHYRNIDVSSIMEVGWRHNPDLMKVQPKKVTAHTAKSDILESIAQLKWYRKYYLKLKEETKDDIEMLSKQMEGTSINDEQK